MRILIHPTAQKWRKLSEAHLEEALKLANRVPPAYRDLVHQLLVDAERARKYTQAVVDIHRILRNETFTAVAVMEVYEDLDIIPAAVPDHTQWTD